MCGWVWVWVQDPSRNDTGVHNDMRGLQPANNSHRNPTMCRRSAKVIITGNALGSMEPAVAAFSFLKGAAI